MEQTVRKIQVHTRDGEKKELYWLELLTEGRDPRKSGRGALFASRAALCLGTLGWGYLDGEGCLWKKTRFVGTRKDILSVSEPLKIWMLPFSWTSPLRKLQL